MTQHNNFLISTIPDNEAAYFCQVEAAIQSVDNSYYLSITKTPDSYKIRISLDDISYTNSLISVLNNLNTGMQLKIEWGKSLKKGCIFYSVWTK